MDTTIDTLAIEIETEAGKSFKNIDALIKRLDKLNASLTQLTTHYSKVQNVIKGVNNIKIKDVKVPKATVQKATKSKVVDTGNISSLLNEDVLTSTEKTVKVDVENKEDLDNVDKELKDVKNTTKSTKKDFDGLKKSIDAVSNTGKGISKLNKILNSTSTGAKKIEEAFKKSFAQSITSSVKKFGLAMIGVRSLFTALRASVQEYMQYDTQLEDTLRNNWAVLGSLLAPALEKIIQLFGIAVAYVRAFIKALTGIDLVAKANKKSMDAVGESAKKTLGNLAKFDNLNVVEFPSNEGSGNDIPPLTTPEIDTSKIDWFVKYIKEGNWYGLGMEIGRKFNDGLRTIDFDWFTKKAQQWATNIADLFNGLTDGVDWALLGEKISGGLNTILAFVNTFVDSYNFDNLGTSLAEGLNSLVANLDWEGLGQYFTNGLSSLFETGWTFVTNFDFASFGTSIGKSINSALYNIDFAKAGMTIANTLTGILTSIGSAINNIDWGSVGQSISDFVYGLLSELQVWIQDTDWSQVGQTLYDNIVSFLSEIDWAGIVESIFGLLGSALGALGSVIGKFVENIVNSIADYFSQYIEEGDDWRETGGNIIMGVLEGIYNGIKNIGTWIYDNILVPFIDGFKEAFNINSPSKVMEEQGKFVWEGFLNAFTNVKDSIKKKWNSVKEAIKEKIKEIMGDIKSTFSKENISNIFDSVKTAITSKFNDIKNNIKSKISDAFTSIKNTFTASKIGQIFQKVFDKIKSIFKNIGTTVGNAIGDSFSKVVNSIISFAENTINKFIRAINKAIGVINEIPGVNIKKVTEIKIPKLATGTNRIESEGLYHLHKNEAVVPEKYNPAVNDDLYNNKGVIEALGMVYDAINNLSTTNIVNLGNKTLYKETIKYAKNQNEIYGENVMSF